MAQDNTTGGVRGAYAAAIAAHGQARMLYYEEFMRAKMQSTPDSPVTDKQAEARAILATQDAMNRTGLLLDLARKDLEREIYGQEPTSTDPTITH